MVVRAPASSEDAMPRLLSEAEVDVPAALRGPLDPIYPEDALRSHREADVVATVSVRSDGKVLGVRIVEAPTPGFAEAAEAALWGADFAPARKGKHPVSSIATLRVRFRVER